ncbi:class I SAM-dependent methyltransferase [Methanospirillum lacunae]|uniref:Class I SAM-dependent methyltransferase n=1 Tax=Methanospirillum lacunae TaxID=668570 RepID=A0A2V2N106_9EURY|nr:class I SAM-dependent methyltransferase [Methanospirillum lacunae]PWR71336.1 class I SAM-dependent methyltransferase [Methanospirillum lacunae]
MKTEDADRYDNLTRSVFAQIYPVIASQILEKTGIRDGTCIDIGSGPGPLSMALVTSSNLSIMALDNSAKMQSLLMKNTKLQNLSGRIHPIIGDVHRIPLTHGSCDLVVSRGSYHFWRNLPIAFNEIRRVLRDGGLAYIGGGYGSSEIRNAVNQQKKENSSECDMETIPGVRFRKYGPGEIEDSIRSAGISEFRIINDESGFWIIFSK